MEHPPLTGHSPCAARFCLRGYGSLRGHSQRVCTHIREYGVLGPCSRQSLDMAPMVHLRLEAEGPKRAGVGGGMWGGRESPRLVPHISALGRLLSGAFLT